MAFVSTFTGTSVTARARKMVSSRPASIHAARQTRMSLAPVVQDVVLKANDAALILAAKDGDFGGYAGPIIGLLIICIIIAVLTPPVKE